MEHKNLNIILNNGVIVMTSLNLVIYSGIALVILGVILFVISQFKLRGIENEIDKQKKLHESFIRNKTK